MRLLEFSQNDSDTALQPAAHVAPRIKSSPDTPPTQVHPVRQPAGSASPEAKVFPVKGNTVLTPAQRGPIDLESLQQRVESLEKRVSLRVEMARANTPALELEQLRQRLLKLERSINGELWAAKQREYTLLEMLARPTLGARITQRMTRIRTHNLPATGRWLIAAGKEWWQDRQPDWWPAFARAWQESLDKARDF